MAPVTAFAAVLLLASAAAAAGPSGGPCVAPASCAAGGDEGQAVSLLQTGSRAAARAPSTTPDLPPWVAEDPTNPAVVALWDIVRGASSNDLVYFKEKSVTGEDTLFGRTCVLCSAQLDAYDTSEEMHKRFPDGEPPYRTDCGKQNVWENMENGKVPVASMAAPAEPGRNATNGFCETNFFGMCAHSLWNRDFSLYAKAWIVPDWFKPSTMRYKMFCKYNGLFEPEIAALRHDFDAMHAKSDDLCSTKYAKYLPHTLTTEQYTAVWRVYDAMGYPTKPMAEWMAAFMCAMGSLGCEMTFCNYEFCDMGMGAYGVAEDCPGWDRMKGVGAPAR